MEILQTIWTALTTENAVLTNVLFIPFMFIEMYLTMLLFTSLLNISSTPKQRTIYVIALAVLGNLTNLFVPKPYNTFLNVILCPIAVMLIFKTKIFKAILCEILPYVIFVVAGVIMHNLYIIIFNVATDTLVTIPIWRLASSFGIYICVYLIYLLLKHFDINIKILDGLKNKSNNTLLFNFIIGILAVSLQSYIAFLYSDSLPFEVIILNLSILLLYFIFSMYSLIRTNKLEITQRDLEQSKQYIKTLTILHDNIRCFKHDFGNMVTTIGRLCTVK